MRAEVIKGVFKNVEGWHEVGATGEPAFGANWSAYGASFLLPSFYKDPLGRAHIEGLVTHTVSGVGSVIFTLPEGYRPSADIVFTADGGAGSSRVDVYSNGGVSLVSGSAVNYLSLNGISFRAT